MKDKQINKMSARVFKILLYELAINKSILTFNRARLDAVEFDDKHSFLMKHNYEPIASKN